MSWIREESFKQLIASQVLSPGSWGMDVPLDQKDISHTLGMYFEGLYWTALTSLLAYQYMKW